ncbi:potassium channel family protein [Thalassospira xianhensis]|uniref:Potassium channel protein n=1 Tax=Thalassospira xianhensis MCCC 1A02616 TaxID=1177929 RepID=A0A367UHK1_9PROT|nr:potassium channel family protein [Thalassospira xianhensis]RCK07787.1 hypothetical protein TH5_01715 [Thalassospira xianhensis MCCC 1A02616]
MKNKSEFVQKALFKLYLRICDMSWNVLFMVWIGHMAASKVLYMLIGDPFVDDPIDFLYFYQTTATTVGYGDLSPSTAGGKLVTIAFVQPGAIALFTTVVAKGISTLAGVWRARMEGRGDFRTVDGATVIVGYHYARTKKMIRELLDGGQQASKIIVLATEEVMLDQEFVRYIRAETYDNVEGLRRSGCQNAAQVIVDTGNDAVNSAVAMAVRSINTSAHMVAYIEDEAHASILEHTITVDCLSSHQAEMLVRAVQDPGLSVVMTALLSASNSSTIFSVVVPDAVEVTADWLRQRLHQLCKGTLLAVERNSTVDFHVTGDALPAGTRVYFVSPHRLSDKDIGWQAKKAA